MGFWENAQAGHVVINYWHIECYSTTGGGYSRLSVQDGGSHFCLAGAARVFWIGGGLYCKCLCGGRIGRLFGRVLRWDWPVLGGGFEESVNHM